MIAAIVGVTILLVATLGFVAVAVVSAINLMDEER